MIKLPQSQNVFSAMESSSTMVTETPFRWFDGSLRSSIKNPFILNLIVGFLYYTFGRLGQLVAIPPGNITPIWAPSGIALASVILLGLRVTPGILIAAFFGNVWAFFDSQSTAGIISSLLAGAGVAVGSTLQPLIGTKLLLRFTKERPFLSTWEDAIRFSCLTFAICMVSSTIGTLSLYLCDALENYVTAWVTWWLGDAMGMLIFTPFAYSLVVDNEPHPEGSHRELVTLIVSVGLVTYVTFGQVTDFQAVEFLIIPFLLWAALRFGTTEVMGMLALVTAIALTLWSNESTFAGKDQAQ